MPTVFCRIPTHVRTNRFMTFDGLMNEFFRLLTRYHFRCAPKQLIINQTVQSDSVFIRTFRDYDDIQR